MNALRDNPVGMALAGFAGFVVLLGLTLAWLWSRPVSAPATDAAAIAAIEAPAGASAVELAPVSAYRVVTDRPLFSETRRPTVGGEPLEEEIADIKPDSFSPPPAARLTGIVITPERKMATLMPEGGGEPLLALEGQALEGEYSVWEVQSIEPRQIRLLSRAGRELTMELMVHDATIAEPPKPEPPPQADDAADDEAADSEDGDAPSRAEQIRQRIEERREELRRQQEERAREEAEEQANQPDPRRDYMRAVSGMMSARQQNDTKEEDDNDKE